MEEEIYLTQGSDDDSDLNNPQSAKDLNALQNIFNILSSFDKRTIKKILRTVLTYYDLENTHTTSNEIGKEGVSSKGTRFSDNRDISPKDFIMEKNPQTDVEKVACLAYYLTHYKNQEEFKTIDLSKLNIEAAQIKFANAAVPVDHATRHAHFLVSTKKGYKKLSAIGELYVQALPDREEAKNVIAKNKPRKKSKKYKPLNEIN
jgi:hypothetical protein